MEKNFPIKQHVGTFREKYYNYVHTDRKSVLRKHKNEHSYIKFYMIRACGLSCDLQQRELFSFPLMLDSE